MDTVMRTATAVVTGARHLRAGRNGQDAAAAWLGAGGDPAGRPGARVDAAARAAGVVVVCDGCSSGASSEVGARLGAQLFAQVVAAGLAAGERPTSPALWDGARAETVRALAELLDRMPGDRIEAIRDHFLFTVVAAAMTDDAAAVWALGDGAYSFGDVTRVVGPFEDNAPPYLAYDLLGDAREACFAIAPASCATVIVATDGASELDTGVEMFADDRFVTHPDALRRHLVVLARAHERIDWAERRVVRTPARLQDDCAIAVLHRGNRAQGRPS